MSGAERAAGEAADLARLYDVDLLDDPGDVDLYTALAATTERPILELGVGSGRIAVPLAVAGHRVTGVDRDAAMLARARDAAARRGADVAARITLVQGDIDGLRLPSAGDFGLAFVALNTLMLLANRDAQRDAIATMATLSPAAVARSSTSGSRTPKTSRGSTAGSSSSTRVRIPTRTCG